MNSLRNALNPTLWGISIALSWTWGLGLFFSVQIALLFGMGGLLAFAIPNAIGLFLFGWLTARMARKFDNSRDFERVFLVQATRYRWVIYAYQIIAITLTLFAAFRYIFIPMGMVLPLMALLILGAVFFLGEKFDIGRIKWSHGAMFLVLLASVAVIGFQLPGAGGESGLAFAEPHKPLASWGFVGYLVPMTIGLLLGPWLDLQQWQRAIRIHHEKTCIRRSYLIGSLLFFAILLFHGTLALVIFSIGGEAILPAAADGLFHAKDAVILTLFTHAHTFPIAFKIAYLTFLVVCIISTLDSGYIALRWYLNDSFQSSDNMLLSMLPIHILSSPVLYFVLMAVGALIAIPFGVELEYFMAFYGSFAVGYSLLFLVQTIFRMKLDDSSQVTLFSVASVSLAIFGIGYFKSLWWAMAIGGALPLVHAVMALSAKAVVDDLQRALENHEDGGEESLSGKAAEKAIHALETAITRLDPRAGESVHKAIQRIEPAAAQALAHVLSTIHPVQQEGEDVPAQPIESEAIEHAKGHFEESWFVHTFMATYQDTNSVGNVYFGQYAMYVGKVREMFFNYFLKDFDLKKTPFLILTRQFEHKFINEAREFDLISVRIRIASYNRRFVTLEHEILNQARTMLGKGKQVLFFVSSKDYSLINLPQELQKAFYSYLKDQEKFAKQSVGMK